MVLGEERGCDTHFECLANTEDNPQSTIQRCFRLTRNELHTPTHTHTYQPPYPNHPPSPQKKSRKENPSITHLITLLQHRPPLTMPHQRPPHPTPLQLLRTNLPRERSIPLIKHILRRDFDFGFEVFADEEEEEGGGGDYDFWGGVSGGMRKGGEGRRGG